MAPGRFAAVEPSVGRDRRRGADGPRSVRVPAIRYSCTVSRLGDLGRLESASTMASLDEFESHRPVLFGIAYRMLGSAAEAEDAVQNAYLRWKAAAPKGDVR